MANCALRTSSCFVLHVALSLEPVLALVQFGKRLNAFLKSVDQTKDPSECAVITFSLAR